MVLYFFFTKCSRWCCCFYVTIHTHLFAGQHKRFRPTSFNPNNHVQNRRPVGMGVPGGQRHHAGSRGGKRHIRWNGREMSVQLHKTIVVKVLVCATDCARNRKNNHRSFWYMRAWWQPNGVVILNSGGWRTMQTLTTINSVIKFIQLRIHFIGRSSCLCLLLEHANICNSDWQSVFAGVDSKYLKQCANDIV